MFQKNTPQDILNAVTGNLRNYSPEQISVLEKGLQSIAKKVLKAEEAMSATEDTDQTLHLLSSIDAI